MWHTADINVNKQIKIDNFYSFSDLFKFVFNFININMMIFVFVFNYFNFFLDIFIFHVHFHYIWKILFWYIFFFFSFFHSIIIHMDFLFKYWIPFVRILSYFIQEVIISNFLDTFFIKVNDLIFVFISAFYCQFIGDNSEFTLVS